MLAVTEGDASWFGHGRISWPGANDVEEQIPMSFPFSTSRIVFLPFSTPCCGLALTGLIFS